MPDDVVELRLKINVCEGRPNGSPGWQVSCVAEPPPFPRRRWRARLQDLVGVRDGADNDDYFADNCDDDEDGLVDGRGGDLEEWQRPPRWRQAGRGRGHRSESRGRDRSRSLSRDYQAPKSKARRGHCLDVLYQADAAVLLEGLGRPLDGQVGRLQADVVGGLAMVVLPAALGSPVVCVPLSGLRPLAPGTPAELDDRGESAPSSKGRVASFDRRIEMYVIVKANGGGRTTCAAPSAIRPHKLLDLPLGDEGREGAGAEHRCRFADSGGTLRCFRLYLPSAFSMVGRAWPVLLFLHGSAGGTLMAEKIGNYTRKSASSLGMRFVASHFVTVTPECDWSWKDEPGPWVVELVEQLSAATWCDATRVYATGVSMGGMGCWEVCTAAPELFAAIAPVAAYHKAERRHMIADALTRTPIFAVHSPSDECCKFRTESRLWGELRLRGNPPTLQDNITGPHGSTWWQAYDADTLLWDFLLSQQRP